eukprot:TRINITY_DN12208_c0_g1_i3.p1 TRINITY_DN12208_c0_g1~~TRINITY_DN12208_c0_g1_i3.p1  ORF type:complete len:197 (-),score=45.25 TRINITY_DN12208_c0_g1_i3:487-1077(-)
MAKIDLVFSPEYPDLKFIIMEQPKPAQTQHTLKELRNFRVHDVVRVCEEYEYQYNGEFEEQGIGCHAFPFPDGTNPSPEVIQQFLELCDTVSAKNAENKKPVDASGSERRGIAIHCVAGLGRFADPTCFFVWGGLTRGWCSAPLMVALAFIEAGMDNLAAVTLVRKRRSGAFNPLQLKFLEKHQRTRSSGGCCTIL